MSKDQSLKNYNFKVILENDDDDHYKLTNKEALYVYENSDDEEPEQQGQRSTDDDDDDDNNNTGRIFQIIHTKRSINHVTKIAEYEHYRSEKLKATEVLLADQRGEESSSSSLETRGSNTITTVGEVSERVAMKIDDGNDLAIRTGRFSLTMVDLSNTDIRCIGNWSFGECHSLQSIKFPPNLERIGKGAFYGCSQLPSFEKENGIPESVQDIGDEAFANCTQLQSIKFPKEMKLIHSGVLKGCTNLSSVDLSNECTEIGGFAFYGCRSLKDIKLSDTAIRKIGFKAFYKCQTLSALSFPKTLEKIGKNSFESCSSLKEITFVTSPAVSSLRSSDSTKQPYRQGEKESWSLVEIGAQAFQHCTSLNDIILPSSVQTIGPHTFENCISLETIYLSDSLKFIGHAALFGCPRLKNVILPTSLGAINNTFLSENDDKNISLVPNNELLSFFCTLNHGGRKFLQRANHDNCDRIDKIDYPLALLLPLVLSRTNRIDMKNDMTPIEKRSSYFVRQEEEHRDNSSNVPSASLPYEIFHRSSIIYYMLVHSGIWGEHQHFQPCTS